jgi:hypothetical protein
MNEWRNTKKFKGQLFVAGYEYPKNSAKRVLKFKHKTTGRELKDAFGSAQQAHKAGWVKIK